LCFVSRIWVIALTKVGVFVAVFVRRFIVNRPANEPGFYLERGEGPGRMIRYTIKSYSVQANPEGGRY
jgi:hypothetical protein